MKRTGRAVVYLVILMAVFLFATSLKSTAHGEMEIVVGRVQERKLAAVIEQLALEYRKTHPEIRIRILPDSDRQEDHYLDLDEYLEKFKDVPDIIGIVYQVEKRLEELPYLVNQGYLLPVEEWPGWDEYDKSDFFESLGPPIEYKGKHWGIPIYAEQAGVGYSFEAFKRAGIKELPVSLDEFVQVWRKTTCDLDGDGDTDQYGLALPDVVAVDFWLICVRRMGASLYRHGRFDLSDEKLRTAFRMIRRLKDEGVTCEWGEFLAAGAPSQSDRFAANQYVQTWQFSHYESYIPPGYVKPITAKVGVLPFPSFESDEMPVIENVYLGIRRNPKATVEACFDFIKLVASRNTQMNFVQKYDWLPIQQSVYESEEFQRKVEGKPWLKVFTDNLRCCRPIVQRPGATEAFLALRKYFTLAYQGRMTIEEALSEAESKMNEILDNSDETSLTSFGHAPF